MVTSAKDTVSAWQQYLRTAPGWETLVKGVTPKDTDCGPVYEIANPIDRHGEGFAISDMRGVRVAGPHYHTNGETEIYFVLVGMGTVVVGGKEIAVSEGSVVVTPPDTAHFTIQHGQHGLVLAVVNTPPFNVANYVALTESNPDVGYDRDQFLRLSA
jgi:mannose-6-phosphate isomerase-like protein (cupin superfamily)